MKKYIEIGEDFMGLNMPNVGFLIIDEPNRVLDKKHQTKLLGIIGWNMIQLVYKVFMNKYGKEHFNSFQYPVGVNPLLFSQLCLYHYTEISKIMVMECDLFTTRQIKRICPLKIGSFC